VLALYGLYEFARGLVVGNGAEAERHARRLAATERSLTCSSRPSCRAPFTCCPA
jgi:siroheme synthase (precorrin-2 oxidase/ferrochelatase)